MAKEIPEYILKDMDEEPVPYEVRVSTLDEDFKGCDARFDVVKIDVEGLDLRILKGGERFLEQNLRQDALLCVEWNPHALKGDGLEDPFELVEFLRYKGFRVHAGLPNRGRWWRVEGRESLNQELMHDLLATRSKGRLAELSGL